MNKEGIIPYKENRRLCNVYIKGYDVLSHTFEVNIEDSINSVFLPEKAFRYLGNDRSYGPIKKLPSHIADVATYHSMNTYVTDTGVWIELDSNFFINGKFTLAKGNDRNIKTEMKAFETERGLLYDKFLYRTDEIVFITVAEIEDKEQVLIGPDKIEALLPKSAFDGFYY
jgi:hypothetical protein